MAERKKQHYVPRFYLKNFSQNGLINVFNLKNRDIINDVPYKDQCYEDYFYGSDGIVEKNLGNIEEKTKLVIDNIIDGNIPEINSYEYEILLIFTIIQFSRTKFAAERSNEGIDKITQLLLKENNVIEEPENYKIGIKNPAVFTLSVAIESSFILFDLDFKIIHNQSSIDFITSDNPVVTFNQYYKKGGTCSTNGLASSGLLLMLPVNPKLLILLYDHEIYNIMENKRDINVFNQNDIALINSLQCLNMNDTFYFSKAKDSKNIKKWASKIILNKPDEKVKLNKYPIINGKTDSIIKLKNTTANPNKRLSFVKINKMYENIPVENRRCQERNKFIIELSERFLKLVDKGIYRKDEFPRFLKEKYNYSIKI